MWQKNAATFRIPNRLYWKADVVVEYIFGCGISIQTLIYLTILDIDEFVITCKYVARLPFYELKKFCAEKTIRLWQYALISIGNDVIKLIKCTYRYLSPNVSKTKSSNPQLTFPHFKFSLMLRWFHLISNSTSRKRGSIFSTLYEKRYTAVLLSWELMSRAYRWPWLMHARQSPELRGRLIQLANAFWTWPENRIWTYILLAFKWYGWDARHYDRRGTVIDR